MEIQPHPLERGLMTLGSLTATLIVLLSFNQGISAQWNPSPSPSPNTNIYYNAGNVGIGTTSSTQGRLVLSDSAQNSARLVLSGQEFYGANVSSSDGVAFLLGVNRTGNKQLWIADSSALTPNSTNVALRALVISGSVTIDAIGTDGLTPKQLGIGNSGGVYVPGNVGIGTSTVPSWSSNYKVLSMNTTGFGIAAGNSSANNGNFVSENAYYDGAWKYTTTNPASVFTFAGGTQQIRVAGSGTSGNNITWISALSVDNSGSVGINKATPNASYRLDVNGDTNVTGNLNTSGTITGGNIQAKYQDVAEWVPSSEQVTAGTVVVLDTSKSNQVISSTESYDTRVAGVVSEQPGIALGEEGAGKVLVATTGRVLVKVDASRGPIHIGDLLVTSDLPGVAMKSEPVQVGKRMMHLPGTLIGKALEPLEKGSGKILVLLSLQ